MTPDARVPELLGGSARFHARIAGAVGVAVLVTGSFAGFAGSTLLVRGDGVKTAGNIVGSETLFRLGIAGGLAMMVVYLFYAMLLYRLLEPVSRNQAAAMMALVLVSIPLFMLNQVFQFAALPLAAEKQYGSVKLFLDLHRFGNQIAGIFFGLWLVPLGLLVLRSGFLPRVLGFLLLLGSPGYVVVFVQAFLFPGSERSLWTNPLLVVTHLSELALMLWLLVRGVDADRWRQRARESAGGGPGRVR